MIRNMNILWRHERTDMYVLVYLDRVGESGKVSASFTFICFFFCFSVNFKQILPFLGSVGTRKVLGKGKKTVKVNDFLMFGYIVKNIKEN